MHSDGRAMFAIDGEAVVPTEYARGPWDARACHGGPISALLVRAAEQVDATGPWQLARISVDLLRPVPVLEPLQVAGVVERPGRMVSLVASSLLARDGTELAKARVLRIRRAEVDLDLEVEREDAFGEPGAGERGLPPWADDVTAFHRDSVELRFSEGSFDTLGPVAMWCRLLVPVFAGEDPSGAQRAVCAADFSNGVSAELDAQTRSFINPDLTVHLARPPVGEWIGVRARSHYGMEGAGVADAALYDQDGRLGRAAQSLLLAPR